MKFRQTRGRSSKKHELQMTPMIDIVFLLLVFFILTFRIVMVEGDFDLRMAAAPTTGPPNAMLTSPLRLTLRADDAGHLTSIHLNQRSFENLQALGDFLIASYAADSASQGLPEQGLQEDHIRESAEIEIDCDPQLHYNYTIEAITHIRGFIDNNGKTIPLIETPFPQSRKRIFAN